MKKLVTLRLNKPGLVAEAGLPGARVLPRDSWLQREVARPHANARHSGCQPATALGMGCGGIVAWTKLENPETREISTPEIRDTERRIEVEKRFAYSFTALYHKSYKPQLFSRTGPAARVSCGVWYLTQETDAEPVVYSHGINSTRVPSPLVASGTGRMGGKNNPHKPPRYFEAACAVCVAIQLNYDGF